MAAKKGGGGNWQTSIVDLLKLLNLDSSLAARKQLAGELNGHIGADGSVEENVALHKAVMSKLAENGERCLTASRVERSRLRSAAWRLLGRRLRKVAALLPQLANDYEETIAIHNTIRSSPDWIGSDCLGRF